ncbi:hypothetical protein QJS10_CPB18g01645 [Acorus calamus]|uniref:Uncharacterized protein n=1 Tax=Acorus calamus TaxID=4465 RepID=A0AAV9CMC9_ACOCL|nr:hypothetical protein QJS10_CPB18g01645 [Acorus calamus]
MVHHLKEPPLLRRPSYLLHYHRPARVEVHDGDLELPGARVGWLWEVFLRVEEELWEIGSALVDEAFHAGFCVVEGF